MHAIREILKIVVSSGEKKKEEIPLKIGVKGISGAIPSLSPRSSLVERILTGRRASEYRTVLPARRPKPARAHAERTLGQVTQVNRRGR